MLALRRVVQPTRVAVRTYARTANKAAGGAADHHDDHEHHDHPMWEELPFKKSTIGGLAVGFIVVGVGAVWGSCMHQNKKHGFSKKK